MIDLREAIRRRAEEIYVRNGKVPGRDLENWAQAENEVRGEAEAPGRRVAIIVKVSGIDYGGSIGPISRADTRQASLARESQSKSELMAIACLCDD